MAAVEVIVYLLSYKVARFLDRVQMHKLVQYYFHAFVLDELFFDTEVGCLLRLKQRTLTCVRCISCILRFHYNIYFLAATGVVETQFTII